MVSTTLISTVPILPTILIRDTLLDALQVESFLSSLLVTSILNVLENRDGIVVTTAGICRSYCKVHAVGFDTECLFEQPVDIQFQDRNIRIVHVLDVTDYQ